MSYSFFALISRMRYIRRWGLMRNSLPENIQEHSHMAAVIAHCLAVVGRDICKKDTDPNACAATALYHDASEILTGDLPTPIKYNNDAIRNSYKDIEKNANRKLLGLLPENLKASFEPLLMDGDEEIHAYVKAADKLSAYIKCIEERKAGNNEFISAETQILSILKNNPLPEVKYFLENFIPAFELTLDELGSIDKE